VCCRWKAICTNYLRQFRGSCVLAMGEMRANRHANQS
jgi:hypothetical protein